MQAVMRWERSGNAALCSAWFAKSRAPPRRPAGGAAGAESLSGRFVGLDAQGALQLQLADGAVRRIQAADLFFAGQEPALAHG